MEDGRTSDRAEKTGNRSDPTDGKTVPDGEKTGTAAGCQRDRDCDGCRKRGRTGGALDLKRSEKPETVPETVGVFRDRQGDPGWICSSEKQQRVRSVIPGSSVPRRSGLAGRHQRDQSTDLQI